MKKFVSSILVSLILLLSVVPAFASPVTPDTADDSAYSFDIDEGGVHVTSAFIIENGIPRPLSRDEYISLMSQEEDYPGCLSNSANLSIGNNEINAMQGFSYSFKPTTCAISFRDELIRRVSPIYQNASSINVSSTYSYTRTVTNSGGASITAGVQSVIDAKVSATYSYSTSASSSTSSSITGVLRPSGRYSYAAAVFTPRIATVSGVLTETLSAMGASGSTNYNCSFRYPTRVSGYLDGIYSVYETNNRDGFPNPA